MKGQNLRVMMYDQFFAGSMSCNLSLNATTENVTSNDTEGDFDEIEVTGKSWEITTEALVFGGLRQYIPVTTFNSKSIGGTTYKISSQAIEIPEGHKIVLGNQTSKRLILTDRDGNNIIEMSGLGDKLIYSNYEDHEVWVHVGCEEGDFIETLIWELGVIIPEDCLYPFNSNTGVFVTLEITGGSKNREIIQDVVSGKGFITEFSINATNRQHPLYSVKISGNGILLNNL